jgi:hypothetical protein
MGGSMTNKLTPEQKIGMLEVELLKAKREAAKLRKALSINSRTHKRIEKAYEDALLLAAWRAAGIIPSRRYAGEYEMTQFRYENAFGLLKFARVIQGHRRWMLDDLATIEAKLARARNRAFEDPPAFFLYLNKHCTPCYSSSQ